jgi:hypothetical protein
MESISVTWRRRYVKLAECNQPPAAFQSDPKINNEQARCFAVSQQLRRNRHAAVSAVTYFRV